MFDLSSILTAQYLSERKIRKSCRLTTSSILGSHCLNPNNWHTSKVTGHGKTVQSAAAALLPGTMGSYSTLLPEHARSRFQYRPKILPKNVTAKIMCMHPDYSKRWEDPRCSRLVGLPFRFYFCSIRHCEGPHREIRLLGESIKIGAAARWIPPAQLAGN